MLPIRAEIVQYADELHKCISYIEDVDAIAHLIHRSGMWCSKEVQVSIDNCEVFSVEDWESRLKFYMSNYDMVSSTSDYREVSACSLVKYTRGSQDVNVCGSLYTMQEAYDNFEEIQFQHSTLNHQSALDGFELIMYTAQCGIDRSFLLTTPMDIVVLKEFNHNFDKMIQDAYESFGRYRA